MHINLKQTVYKTKTISMASSICFAMKIFFRPAGSRDVYYTESGDDTNESGTTLESTHAGK